MKRRAAITANDFRFGRRMDENTRVVEVSSLAVTLVCNDEHDGDIYDPGRIFSRLGYLGADAFTRLSAQASETATSLTVDSSVGFAADDYIHIGQETLKIASVVDSTTLSVVRGVLGTIPRIHRVDEPNGSFPYVTKPLSYFKGRRVILYEGRVGEDGSVSSSIDDYVEVFRGFFATEPTLATAGRAMNAVLEIAPLTALFDKPLSTRTKTSKLHPRLHAFDGTNAGELAVIAYAKRGDLFRDLRYNASVFGQSFSNTPVVEVTTTGFDAVTRIVTIGSFQQGNEGNLQAMIGGSIESNGVLFNIEDVDYFNNKIRLSRPASSYQTGSGQRMRVFNPDTDQSAVFITSNKFADIASIYYTGAGDFHPRKFKFHISDGGEQDGRVAYVRTVSPGNEITVDSAHIYPEEARDNFKQIELFRDTREQFMDMRALRYLTSDRYVEAKVIRMTTTGTVTNPDVKEWPAVLETSIMNALGGVTSTAVDGFFCKVMLDPTSHNLVVTSNLGAPLGKGASKLNLVMSKDRGLSQEYVVEQIGEVSNFEEIVGTTAATNSHTGAILETIGVGTNSRRDFPKGVFDVSEEDTVTEVSFETSSGNPIADAVQIETRVASAYYSLGTHRDDQGEVVNPLGRIAEAFIMLESSLSLGASGGYFEAVKGDDVQAILYLEDETELTVNGITGYRYKVTRLNKLQPVDALVDHPGEDRIVFRPTVVPSGSTIGEIVLKLLCSSDGKSKSSVAYDKFLIGCGLSDDTGHSHDFGSDVEVNSFLAMPNPINGDTFSLTYREGETVLETLEGILASVNYTIDVRTDAVGRCRLTAVEMGLPNSDMSVANLTTAEIADSPTPISSSEISIKNVFNFKTNHDFEGKPEVELTVRDQVSIDLFNEASELEVDMKGIRLNASSPGDAIAELRPVFQRLRVENSYPRRLFSFDVIVASLLGLSLGDTVTISHPQLRGVSGLGVSSILARVRSIEYDGLSPTGSIEAIAYGVAGGVWNRTAEIVAQSTSAGTTTFTVKSQDHSPSRNPLNNETIKDSSGFAVGDTVDIFDAASFDLASATATITSIPNDTTIKFTGLFNLTGAPGGALGYIVSTNDPTQYAKVDQVIAT
ncbi:hypothetical protein [Rubinisphaera sp.]|uniref:hypothetical protein n=1 Tax=Rubinisphaera sp. TaxID=2024857 RepID=UPI0025F3E7F6|nr:hypothetical protein [Rubinisphaera sp.]